MYILLVYKRKINETNIPLSKPKKLQARSIGYIQLSCCLINIDVQIFMRTDESFCLFDRSHGKHVVISISRHRLSCDLILNNHTVTYSIVFAYSSERHLRIANLVPLDLRIFKVNFSHLNWRMVEMSLVPINFVGLLRIFLDWPVVVFVCWKFLRSTLCVCPFKANVKDSAPKY